MIKRFDPENTSFEDIILYLRTMYLSQQAQKTIADIGDEEIKNLAQQKIDKILANFSDSMREQYENFLAQLQQILNRYFQE